MVSDPFISLSVHAYEKWYFTRTEFFAVAEFKITVLRFPQNTTRISYLLIVLQEVYRFLALILLP